MCGIAGSYPVEDAEVITKSLSMLLHRGPDAHRLAETTRGTLAHARLAILDVAAGHQPMRDGERWIAFNGEIYNYRSLRRGLPGPLRTDSDTEVILKLYATHGPACVMALDGMFAFALLDRGQLFLARDPLGIKPLYYGLHNQRLYFASEAKALAWFSQDVHEFPPGHWWHSQYGLHRYYHLEALAPAASPASPTPKADDLARVQEAVRAAVHKRLIADTSVPVGVCLSGGLDSSIVSALAREAKDDLDTFAVGTPTSEDLAVSAAVAGCLGCHHHTYAYSFAEMLDALPEVIYHLESFDAALVRSAIPNYFLARLASDYVKVILTGEGADELFAGYDYLAPIVDPLALHQELQAITGSLHNTNLQRADRMTMAHSIEGRVPFLDIGLVRLAFTLPARWKLRRPGWIEKELLRRAFSGLLPEEVTRRHKAKFSAGAGSARLMAEYANDTISDGEYLAERQVSEQVVLRSKEELLYYRIFRSIFGDQIDLEAVGRTRSVTAGELA